MNEFSAKLDKLVREYTNKHINNLEEAVQNVLLATSRKFLELYIDTMSLREQDIESKIYHINKFFNLCKKEVIEVVTNNNGGRLNEKET